MNTASTEPVDTDDEARFGADADAFVAARFPRRAADHFVWGAGSDEVGVLEDRTPAREEAELVAARQWRAQCFDHGYGWLTGPVEHGGRGLPRAYEAIWQDVQRRYETPSAQPFLIGLGMVVPTILAHGTDELRERYLPALQRADVVACQLFSEPGAGSDLAAVSTRAVRDGDGWRVTGQKVWSSGAHRADIGELVARTDPDAPKHAGITVFLVDMRSPGIEIRPLRQMTGGARFNEVFLDDVWVPDDHRLGAVGEGWQVARTTLMNERVSIGGASRIAFPFERLVETVQRFGDADDALTRQVLVDCFVRAQVLRMGNLRAAARRATGHAPGPEGSIGKLGLTAYYRRVGELMTGVLGPRLVADGGEWGAHAWASLLVGLPGMRIAGGTDEIQRNVLAERVLGLPR